MKFEEALIESREGKKLGLKIEGLSCETIYYIEMTYKNGNFYFSEFPYPNANLNIFYIIFNGDWKIVEEPGKKFDQVFEDFKNGKIIRRKSWDVDYYFISGIPLYAAKYYTVIDIGDLLATDWEVLE